MEPVNAVTEEMDHLRCMLYIHGGAYYCEAFPVDIRRA